MDADRQRLAIEERIALAEGRGSLGPDAAAALAELRRDFERERLAEEDRELRAAMESIARETMDPRLLADLARPDDALDALLRSIRDDDRQLFPALPPPKA